MTVKIDASPGKKVKGIPTNPDGRKAYYERLMGIYAAQNPVKFQAKKAELQKKAEGFEYIAGKWVNIFTRSAEEQKLTPVEREQLGVAEKLNADLEAKKRLEVLEVENLELRAKLAGLSEPKERVSREVVDGEVVDEEVVLETPKPKGRPKKVK